MAIIKNTPQLKTRPFYAGARPTTSQQNRNGAGALCQYSISAKSWP
jgi:hypothetical protein